VSDERRDEATGDDGATVGANAARPEAGDAATPGDVPPDASAIPTAPAEGDGAGSTSPETDPAEPSADTVPEAAAKPVRRRPKDPAVARAHRTGQPMQGTVAAVIKGGYEIRLGRSRAFCPHSQIDVARVEDPEHWVGQTVDFRVMQYRRGGDDVVVSRRALLEEVRADEAKAVRATLLEGAIMRGRVVGIAEFGCFVDLGAGVQGLVHVSELSHNRIQKVDETVRVGDVVNVKILKLEQDGQRISLSVRRAERDPWAGIAERFAVGSTYPGKVVRLADFGAFVEMEPGVEALAPAREFPPTGDDWREAVPPGSERSWRVLAVDRRRRRMSIVPDIAGLPAAPIELRPGETVSGRIQKIERFGVFVWLAPGQVGLMPVPLSGIPQGTRLDSRFRAGDEVRVQIVDVEQDGRRIRLAAEGVDPSAAGSHAERGGSRPRTPEPRTPPGPAQPEGTFGTSLGDALRAALGTGPKATD